ncbi:MAG: helix-turn-helix transcriptional regulator [Oscillospiraceae bacterium]|nr:helix-turn-helix transcriptional regulator [Oscillospiraceae bacterium]
MFSEKINILITRLLATNADIAKYAGFSASNISRFRTGARIPKPGSTPVRKFIEGVYTYADNRNALPLLCSVFGENPLESSQQIKTALYDWLFSDCICSKTTEKEKVVLFRPAPFRFFGDKLNAVMNMLGLSNIRLSRAVNIDPSHISRFRNGVRTPKSNMRLINFICDYLLERIKEQHEINGLAKLMNVSPSLLEDDDYRMIAFREWLCDFGKSGDESAVDRLLESIDSFTPDIKIPLPDFDAVASREILNDSRVFYSGIAGLRFAIIRFLGSIVKMGARELWLYSDQNIKWMTGDSGFRLKWFTLMSECVRRGIKIKIIHNIDRDIAEMISAIESWMPLYMSGIIEPYVCKRSADGRFSHTIFLCPDMACIEACHVKGFEGNGLYNYYTDHSHLELLKKEYLGLLAMCEPLIKIYTENDWSNFLLGSNDLSPNGGVTSLLNSLSIGSMPESLLLSMLKRVKLGENETNQIMSFWNYRKKFYDDALLNGYIYEFIPTASDEQLLSENAPLNLGSIMVGLEIYYTAEEYAQHIKNIITLLDEHTNYRFYLLPEMPFSNMQIIINNGYVIVMKSNTPRFAFTFTHPLMIGAFNEYMNRLKEQYKQDRNSIKQKLARYL